MINIYMYYNIYIGVVNHSLRDELPSKEWRLSAKSHVHRHMTLGALQEDPNLPDLLIA